MGITFSPECGSNFEPEPEETERKKERSPRQAGRPRKLGADGAAPMKSQVRSRVPRFEDFDKD